AAVDAGDQRDVRAVTFATSLEGRVLEPGETLVGEHDRAALLHGTHSRAMLHPPAGQATLTCDGRRLGASRSWPGGRSTHGSAASGRHVQRRLVRRAHGAAFPRRNPHGRDDDARPSRAPPPDDSSVEHYARLTSELAAKVGADVIVGFSMGAVVAVEMVVSGAFTGPVVLLGVSLSTKDEPAFFRALVRLSAVLGGWPFALLAKVAASMVKRIPV